MLAFSVVFLIVKLQQLPVQPDSNGELVDGSSLSSSTFPHGRQYVWFSQPIRSGF